MIQAGEPAPDFTLPDQDGNPVTLSSLRGRHVVVYFYPKAETPGCTAQACGVRDRRTDYEAAGALVLGISPDSPARLRAFADKHGLPFTLLSDADHATAEAYGAWVEKSMYGRRFWGNQRSTFIVGPEGVVAHVIPKAKPATHDDEVLAAIGQLTAA
jgi:thioredoxin-dependent peroxiredoxin